MNKEMLIKILVTVRDIIGVVFLTVLFYAAFAVLSDPLYLFLEKKIEFIYGLF